LFCVLLLLQNQASDEFGFGGYVLDVVAGKQSLGTKVQHHIGLDLQGAGGGQKVDSGGTPP
jgi:hypothetical protein